MRPCISQVGYNSQICGLNPNHKYLDIMCTNSFNQDMESNHVGHILYTEGTEDVNFQIKYFINVNNHYFNNTLMDNLLLCQGCDYNNLNQALAIRHSEWNVLKGVYVIGRCKITPSTASEDVENISRLWGSYKFHKIGMEESNPLRLLFPRAQEIAAGRVDELSNSNLGKDYLGIHSALSAEKTSAVLGWVAEIPQTKATVRRLENIPPNHPDPVAMVNQMKPKTPPPPPKGKF